jgi:hypothetical protein
MNQATRLPLFASLLLITCITGCAGNSAELRLTCTETGAAYRQQFSSAYLSKGSEGTEVVLVSDEDVAGKSASDANAAVAAGQTLEPSAATAVRQVMHVKVLWRPQRGTKQGHPSYTNAALRWYVLGDTGKGKSDVLEYTGAGFVALSDTAGGTRVTIRNASLKPVGQAKGSLNDPVGSANLNGTFLAKKSHKRVNELLAEVKSAVNGAGAQQASAH